MVHVGSSSLVYLVSFPSASIVVSYDVVVMYYRVCVYSEVLS